MSQEDVEVGRRGVEAANRGDWHPVAATMDQHVLLRLDPIWPEHHIYGRDAAIAFYEGLVEALAHGPGPEIEIEEVVDLGDRVVVRLRATVHARASGVKGEQRYTTITTFREGLAILVEFFLEHERALKAVGLEE